MLVDVAIIDYCTSEIIMLKADDDIIVRDFHNNVPAYIEAPVEQGGLGYVPKDMTAEVRKHSKLPCRCYFYIGENNGSYFSDCYIKIQL